VTTSTTAQTIQRPQLLRGKARALELAVANEAERQAVAVGLLADLGREPSHGERLLVEQVSALIIRGRRLRERGMSADAEMVSRLVVRALGKLGVRAGAAKPVGPSLADIAASYARPAPIAQASAEASEAPASETRISEPGSRHSGGAR
jgi:hypothetical protein